MISDKYMLSLFVISVNICVQILPVRTKHLSGDNWVICKKKNYGMYHAYMYCILNHMLNTKCMTYCDSDSSI